jgi:hypothetical protein
MENTPVECVIYSLVRSLNAANMLTQDIVMEGTMVFCSECLHQCFAFPCFVYLYSMCSNSIMHKQTDLKIASNN